MDRVRGVAGRYDSVAGAPGLNARAHFRCRSADFRRRPADFGRRPADSRRRLRHQQKIQGAIGLDRNPASRADVLCDLDHFPYPFRDSTFDGLQAVHVIEHVADVIRPWRNFIAWSAPAAKCFIVTPHYTDFSSFCDPTHRWHLNSFSLRYFGEDNGGFGYYSTGQIRGDFRAREATSFVEMAGIRAAGQHFSALSAFLGTLSMLRGARQSDRVAIAGD